MNYFFYIMVLTHNGKVGFGITGNVHNRIFDFLDSDNGASPPSEPPPEDGGGGAPISPPIPPSPFDASIAFSLSSSGIPYFASTSSNTPERLIICAVAANSPPIALSSLCCCKSSITSLSLNPRIFFLAQVCETGKIPSCDWSDVASL